LKSNTSLLISFNLLQNVEKQQINGLKVDSYGKLKGVFMLMAGDRL